MQNLRIEKSSYPVLAGRFAAAVPPLDAREPRLLAWNDALAAELGLSDFDARPDAAARLFGGTERAQGAEALALAYAGHQFGQFVPQLGDGRAALLGEITGRDGRRYDLQLKGSGRTPFSRGGDGLSALGPVLREYVVSEAMHALGVATTRALAAVATGATVLRDDVEPGAVFTRVAASHLRIGTFEYFASRGDRDAVQTLLDYAIERHYPELRNADRPTVEFLRAVASRQASLVADWMRLGFIHGVMNTDNTSIAGETLDYGPCAFMDEFRHDKVFSSIDRHGRYAYSNQPVIAQWNLARLADCLMVVADELDRYEAIVYGFIDEYEAHYLERMRAKLGLRSEQADDAGLVRDVLDAMEERELDYTQTFRQLPERVGRSGTSLLGDVEERWRARLAHEEAPASELAVRMNAVNPLYIPRNHRVEEAIDRAREGDLSVFRDLVHVLARPIDEQPEYARYAEAPAPEERVTRTFCGT